MTTKSIRKCSQCAWLKKPVIDGYAKCILKGVEIWAESESCSDADSVGVF